MSVLSLDFHAWAAMVAHARAAYPDECCGAMLGEEDEVGLALPLENSAAGSRRTRYEIRPDDLLAATLEARSRGLRLIGIYHSHPDRDAYFSESDLKNSCPWFVFVVLSMKNGEFDHAAGWRPNEDQSAAVKVDLVLPL